MIVIALWFLFVVVDVVVNIGCHGKYLGWKRGLIEGQSVGGEIAWLKRSVQFIVGI